MLKDGFDILCPSVVCEGQVATYSLPVKIAELCNQNNQAWQIPNVSEENVSISEDQKSVKVIWNNVDETGFGTVIYNLESCETNCKLQSVLRVPIIQAYRALQGEKNICTNQSYKYSLPQWPSTIATWVLTNQNGQVFSTITSDQPNERFISLATQGTYTLRATYYNTLINCGGIAQIEINVKQKESIIIGEQNLCLNDQNQANSNYTVYITNENGQQIEPPTVLWTLTNAQGTVLLTETTDAFSPVLTTVGSYTITASAENFCNTTTYPINVYAKPAAPVGTLKQLNNDGNFINIEKVCPDVVYTYSLESQVDLPSNTEYFGV